MVSVSVVLLEVSSLAAGALAQSFQERVKVELVRVEVLATDRDGHPVTNLRPSAIRVRIDGKPVAIEGFEAPGVALRELPVAQTLQTPAPNNATVTATPAPAATTHAHQP
jgi:hypothetical protein